MKNDYRDYTLSIKENKKYKISDIFNFIKDKYEEHEWFYPLYDDLCGLEDNNEIGETSVECEEATIWNDTDLYAEMKELSKAFPECVFELHCIGWDNSYEEAYDYEIVEEWRCYFKNNKYQFCKAIKETVFEEYDEDKLI